MLLHPNPRDYDACRGLRSLGSHWLRSDSHIAPKLLPAFLANSIDLKGVPGGDVAMLEADFLLDLLNLGRKEFD